MTDRTEINARIAEVEDAIAGYRANFDEYMRMTLQLAEDYPEVTAESRERANEIATLILVNQANIFTHEAEMLLLKAQLIGLPDEFDGIDVPDFLPEDI